MTKQGSLDNQITYEFICDTIADMNAIENRYRVIGTTAIVLSNEEEVMEVFISNSKHEWKSFAFSGSSGNSSSGLIIYICSQNEVSNGLPNVSIPSETTLYLVPGTQGTNNLYEEYIWANNAWEKFGVSTSNIIASLIDDTAGNGNTGVTWSANKLVSELTKKYEKPVNGIPAVDLASGVIPDVSGFYTKPASGIPASDLANNTLTSIIDDFVGNGVTNKTWSADKIYDEVSDVKSALNDKANNTDVTALRGSLTADLYTDIELGSIDGSTGNNSSSNARCRTAGYIPVKDFWYCDTRNTLYRIIVFLYDSNKTYIGRMRSSFVAGFVNYEALTAFPTAVYIRIAFAKASGDISSTDISNVKKLTRVFRSNDGNVLNADAITNLNIQSTVSKINADCTASYFIGLEIGSISSDTGADSSSTIRVRTKGYIGINDFVGCFLAGTDYKWMAYIYDTSKTYKGFLWFNFVDTDITRFTILQAVPDAKYIRFVLTKSPEATVSDTDVAYLRTRLFINDAVHKVDHDRSRFDKQFNYVAYSVLSSGDAPANTAEHFFNCANDGKFTALKGDVRNTYDSGLIMCHDAGYTFDANSKITTYNSSNMTAINTLTVAQCKALTFAQQYNGADCHPIDFATFVNICKRYGLIAYVTVRDEHVADVVAPEVLKILKQYRMLDRAIINSFTKASLETFRALNSSIALSLVLNNKQVPTKADVDYVASLGNCILNLFDVPVSNDIPGTNVEDKLEYLLSQSSYSEVLEYATEKCVVVYDAQTGNAAPEVLIRHGIMGSHMVVKPQYDWKRT